MAKVVKSYIKLQIEAGKANPAPPVGPALGQHGVPIQEFCTKFNNETKDKMGTKIPVIITVYADKSFDFICKQPPASDLIKKELGITKGSKEPNKIKIGKITQTQLRKVAELKMPDLNTDDIEAAMRTIAGSAKRLGLDIEE